MFELFLFFFRCFHSDQYDKKTKKRVAKAGLKVNKKARFLLQMIQNN